ncbi:MAG: 3-hydroxybutyryl-CoA dehydrogenase [Rhizobiales bacterium]|nr:3-hydroxybutyryl-CoA dehydrogenase [Hyphomicrobiales bacterium]
MSAIVVVGAGRMGRGIAQVFAYAGQDITILDIKDRPLDDLPGLFDAGRTEISESLSFMAQAGVFDATLIPNILARVRFAGREDAAKVLGQAELVFEGVPERQDAKEEAFAFICTHLPDDAIIASTTSTMLSDMLAKFVTHPERFLNAHWLNPAYLVPLVEVSPAAETSEKVVEKVMDLLNEVGKVPVRCKASPGYIIPRLQTVLINEAVRIVEENVASVEDVDKAVRYGLGLRFATMGPIEFIDWGGLDILYYASRYMTEATGSDRFQAPDSVAEKMQAGDIGMSSGKGYYDFSKIDVEAYKRDMLARFVDQVRNLGLLKPPAA